MRACGYRIPVLFLAALLLPAAETFPGQDREKKTPVYGVDSGNSRVYIRIDSATRLGHAHGAEGKLSASEVNFAGSGTLVFDMTSFQADTRTARHYVGLEPDFSNAAAVNGNMRGPAVLDVARYPKAVFTISAITPRARQAAGAAGRYQIAGTLNLRGITRNVQFDATLQPSKYVPQAMRLTGSFTILQTSYGIEPYSALGGLIRLADELQIHGDLMLVPRNQ